MPNVQICQQHHYHFGVGLECGVRCHMPGAASRRFGPKPGRHTLITERLKAFLASVTRHAWLGAPVTANALDDVRSAALRPKNFGKFFALRSPPILTSIDSPNVVLGVSCGSPLMGW